MTITTRGQITHHGLISRFISSPIQYVRRQAMTSSPPATPNDQRASMPRPGRAPTTTIIRMEKNPEGDCTPRDIGVVAKQVLV